MTKIRINLLPPEHRQPEWHYFRLLMIPIVIMLLIIAATYGYGEYRYWELEQQLEQTRARYDSLGQQERQMQLAQTRQVAIQARQKFLVQLSVSRTSWHAVMLHMGSLMPRSLWLTEIGSAQKGVLQMKGSAANYSDLIFFLGKLEVDRTFIEPALLRVEQNEKDSMTKFEITTKIRGM